jgi:uncharacterized lipoprotein YehR (DUF1307 family)
MAGVKRTPLEIGRKFGHLTVLGDGKDKREGKQNVRMVHVDCVCGVEKEVRYSTLMYEMVKSCGCKSKEMAKETMDRNRLAYANVSGVVSRVTELDNIHKERLTEIMKMEKDILTGKRPIKDISLMHEKTREFLFIK